VSPGGSRAGMKGGHIVRKEGLNVSKKIYFFLCSSCSLVLFLRQGGMRNPILGTVSLNSTCVTSRMWDPHLGDSSPQGVYQYDAQR
jgi:hypothetical protein